MNIYFLGMLIAMAVFVVIGIFVSKKVKSAEDFYVAGRQAPVLLISGSLVASFLGTGFFMGDAAQCYAGALAPIILFAGLETAGYIFGGVYFGRYLRRSKTLTIPEFFGQRFNSNAMRILAAVTAIITMTVYLLSVMQGIGTLMNIVTGVDYRLCIIIALVVFTVISVTAGSKGVLITDTLMAAFFTVMLVVGVAFICGKAGGWFGGIEAVASDPETTDFLSWIGKAGVLGEKYTTGADSIIWGITYGIVWMSVAMVGPWQASRYQMAKSEQVIVKSSYITAIGVFFLEFVAGMGALIVNAVNPGMEDSSLVYIWAAMNLMPKIVGVILLTGVLAAGISSATTFLSLIGATVANDIVPAIKHSMNSQLDKRSITIGRVVMIIAAAIVLVVAVYNPPAIFVIMFLGGSIVACSWMPVALASILSKRVTKAGAFVGMLAGFVGCFILKLVISLAGWSMPSYLDPTIIGIVMCILGLVIGSAVTKVTPQEKAARAQLFVMPDSEKNGREVKKTMKVARWGMLVGVLFTAALILLWVVPYYIGK